MILASGGFDSLHSGHARYLQTAAKLCRDGESLHVSIAPDDYIRQFKDREPYWSQADRGETVLAIGCVNSVTLDENMTPAALIRGLRPRVFVKGEDWRGRLPADVLAACQEVGCEIVFVNTPGRHVSESR